MKLPLLAGREVYGAVRRLDFWVHLDMILSI